MPHSWVPLVIAAGCGSAVLSLGFLFPQPFGVLLFYLTPTPLLLVGLAHGPVMASLSGVVGALMIGVVGGGRMFALFLLLYGLPIAVLVRQALLNRPVLPFSETPPELPSGESPSGGAETEDPGTGLREWYPVGFLMGWLTLMALAGLLLTAVALGGRGEGFEASVTAVVEEMLTELNGMAAGRFPGDAPGSGENPVLGSLPSEELGTGGLAQETLAPASVEVISRALPGAAAAGWMVLMVLNGLLAQAVLLAFGWNRRPALPLVTIQVPRWIMIAFALAFLGSLLAGDLGFTASNAVVVASVPFGFVGLAVIHAAAGRLGLAPIFLLLFYPFILMALPLVLLLGVAESILDLRGRLLNEGMAPPPTGSSKASPKEPDTQEPFGQQPFGQEPFGQEPFGEPPMDGPSSENSDSPPNSDNRRRPADTDPSGSAQSDQSDRSDQKD